MNFPGALSILAVLVLGGCASILNKGNNSIVLGSEPSGATVHINGNQRGTTPFTYNYTPEDGKDVVIEFRSLGYRSSTLNIHPGVSNGVLFADAMLLGIPYIVDRNNPAMYKLPVKEYMVQLYKEVKDDLTHFTLPISGIEIKLGDKPDLGTFQGKKIMLKDGIFKELNYGDPLTSAVQSGLKDSWIEPRAVRLGTTKGEEAIRKSKIYLYPEILSIKADITGKTENCSGKIDMDINWRFMSGTNKDSVLFSMNEKSTYLAFGARSGELLSDAVAHAARVLSQNETLHAQVSAAYGSGLAMSKGSTVDIPVPSAIKFEGRKDMMSALVKAVVTIQTETGHGSGFLISNNGYMITNEHVVEGENSVKVKFEQGFTLDGTVIKTNKDYDLALVKVEATDLPALSIGNDAGLMLGEEIFAIGTPLDATLGQSVSRGILSGRREYESFQYLQTDVSINPGNSGGPLIDETGKVVGVATMKISGKGLEGLGFGVPISIAISQLNIVLE
ncbi:MAG: trypsin-like peptidase domain-containing protein [Bacteroidota bacterium]|nr:trypsin-like peptidase domain-containing protein [Bacteroidota bacterium]